MSEVSEKKPLTVLKAIEMANRGDAEYFIDFDDAVTFAGALAYAKAVKPVFIRVRQMVFPERVLADCYLVTSVEYIDTPYWKR